MEENLKSSLLEAINQYDNKRGQLIDAAFQSGGQTAIQTLENKYSALRNAYLEILQKELNQNNSQYQQLTTAATAETDKLNESVQQLNNINDIIALVTSVLTLVGQVITVLA